MEDFVRYRIYHQDHLTVSTADDARKSSMLLLGESIIQFVSNQTKNYLWSKDFFYIEPHFILNTNDHSISHFDATLHYGRDINDEWFTVYLLYQISNQFKDTVIEVSDNDGQFLLIHSALHLPQWIDPQNVRNRVFIHQSQLHLIPLIHDVTNNLPQSINLVLDPNTNTIAENMKIQQSLNQKLSSLRSAIDQNPGINYHSAIVVLPKHCASILHSNPWMIGHVVDSFVIENDESTQSQSANHNHGIRHRGQSQFPLNPRDYVFVSIRFTRCLYAILDSKPMKSAPLRFRKSKFDHRAYSNLNSKQKEMNQMVENAFILGIKLMIGLEAFYTRCRLESDESTQWDRDREWKQFKQSLIKKGYFRDCTFGTDDYKTKEDGAKQYYKDTMKRTESDKENVFCIKGHCVPGVGPDEVYKYSLKVMDQGIDHEIEEESEVSEQKECGKCIPSVAVYDDDDEVKFGKFMKLRNDSVEWMRISDQELKAVLDEYCYDNNPSHRQMLFEELLDDDDHSSHSSDGDDGDDGDGTDELRKEEMTQQTKDDILSLKESMNSFMEQQSSVHGVEDLKDEGYGDEDGIGFDANAVMEILDGARRNTEDLEQNALREMMEQMDLELSQKQKVRNDQDDNEEEHDMGDDEEDDLDIDLGAVNDILQSHIASQAHDGLGPAATLLSQMGFQLK